MILLPQPLSQVAGITGVYYQLQSFMSYTEKLPLLSFSAQTSVLAHEHGAFLICPLFYQLPDLSMPCTALKPQGGSWALRVPGLARTGVLLRI
jgi:hypothetical protein